MSDTTRLRLLPWLSADGKPAYTPDDSPNGFVARLADRIEAEQLSAAQAVMELSRAMLDDSDRLEPDECRYIMQRLCECLCDALRIAESRGYRLPARGDDD